MRSHRSILVFALICLSTSSSAFAQALDQQEFDRLFGLFGSFRFSIREGAQRDLIAAAEKPGGFTAIQVATIQTGMISADPEVRVRSERVFASLVRTHPASVITVIGQLRVQTNGTNGEFVFGNVKGKYDPADPASRQKFLVLQRHWRALSLGLMKGDVDQVYGAYDAMSAAVIGLGDGGLKDLNLKLNGQDLTVDDYRTSRVNTLDPAFAKIPADIRNLGGNPNPPPKMKMNVPQGGFVPLSKSMRLDVGQVNAPGSLDLTDSPDEFALSSPPPGYEYVGHLYDIGAADGLVAGGTVRIDIEYGDEQLVGNAVRDASALHILRYADGVSTLLAPDPDHTSVADHVLSGTYAVGSLTSQDEAFGEFAIVQAVPEPLSCAAAGAALAAVALLCRPRRALCPV